MYAHPPVSGGGQVFRSPGMTVCIDQQTCDQKLYVWCWLPVMRAFARDAAVLTAAVWEVARLGGRTFQENSTGLRSDIVWQTLWWISETYTE